MVSNSTKKKVALDAQIRLPVELDRQIDIEAATLNVYKYEVVDLMWKAYRFGQRAADNKGDRLDTAGISPGTHSPQMRGKSGVLSDREREAVDLLLLIMRNASERVQAACLAALEGFAEPVKLGGPGGDISAAFERIGGAIEGLGGEEKHLSGLLAKLREVQAEVTRPAPKPRMPA
jgi:hypothetical protein